MVWFPHSSYQQVQQPSIPSPTTIDTLTEGGSTGIELSFSHRPTYMEKHYIHWFLLACTVFGLGKSLIFAFLSLGNLSHAALVLYLSLTPKRRLKWQKRRACKMGQNNFGDAYF